MTDASHTTCLHCGTRPVEGSGSLWWMYTFAVFYWFGNVTYDACGPCFKRLALVQAAKNTAFGWPGVAVVVLPITLPQNLWAAFRGVSPELLASRQDEFERNEQAITESRAAREAVLRDLRDPAQAREIVATAMKSPEGFELTFERESPREPAMIVVFLLGAAGLGAVVGGGLIGNVEHTLNLPLPDNAYPLAQMGTALVLLSIALAFFSREVMRTRVHSDHTHVHVRVERRVGTTKWSAPLGSIQRVEPLGNGLKFVADTTFDARALGLTKTATAAASALEQLLLEPGDLSAPPARS